MKKNEYLTQPRKLLKEFFNQRPDQKFTAKQIFEGLEGKLSMSSIYRNLQTLENQGLIQRFAGHGWEGVFYQYILSDTCQNFVHLTCKKCGKTTHLSAKICLALEKNLGQFEDFCLDKEATTLVGVCKECQKGENI